MSKRKKGGRRSAASDLIPDLAVSGRGVPRRLRVERELHEELAAALASLRDPRLNATAITRVEMTGDLSYARIWVRSGLDREDDPQALVRGLERASGRLRSHIGQTLQLRKAPELRFLYDDGVEAAQRVEALLAEIASEDVDASE